MRVKGIQRRISRRRRKTLKKYIEILEFRINCYVRFSFYLLHYLDGGDYLLCSIILTPATVRTYREQMTSSAAETYSSACERLGFRPWPSVMYQLKKLTSTLTLSHCTVTTASATALSAMFLQLPPPVETILLRHCEIPLSALGPLCNTLASLPRPLVVDCEGVAVATQGSKRILATLRRNPTLQIINLPRETPRLEEITACNSDNAHRAAQVHARQATEAADSLLIRSVSSNREAASGPFAPHPPINRPPADLVEDAEIAALERRCMQLMHRIESHEQKGFLQEVRTTAEKWMISLRKMRVRWLDEHKVCVTECAAQFRVVLQKVVRRVQDGEIATLKRRFYTHVDALTRWVDEVAGSDCLRTFLVTEPMCLEDLARRQETTVSELQNLNGEIGPLPSLLSVGTRVRVPLHSDEKIHIYHRRIKGATKPDEESERLLAELLRRKRRMRAQWCEQNSEKRRVAYRTHNNMMAEARKVREEWLLEAIAKIKQSICTV